MKTIRVQNLGGLNLYTNPTIPRANDLIRAKNVISEPYGAKSKRPGYITYLGTADGSAVNSLFSWTQDDGSLFVYRASGSKLYYSTNGTTAWAVCGNGTITAGDHVGFSVLGNTLIVGDSSGSTRHSTNGTSFTNTTLAPVSPDFVQFQNRIYTLGTSSTTTYSVTNDATNWGITGTSDSSSFTVPGEGKNYSIFKQNDKVHVTKKNGAIYSWDGYRLRDLATKEGPSSPYSVVQTEDFYFWLNRKGIQGFAGDKPQLISNAVQPLIFNNAGSGVAGGTFDTAPGVIHNFDYFLSLGSVSEDYSGYDYPDCVLKYDYQKNEYLTFQFNNFPTAYHSFKDVNGNNTLIWGSSGGQCYQYSGTATTDNGAAIEAILEFIIDAEASDIDKEWRWLKLFFNPGANAKIQVAHEHTYNNQSKKWIEIGDAKSGVVEYRFPSGSQSKLLFLRIYDSSKNTRFSFYGYSIDFNYKPTP